MKAIIPTGGRGTRMRPLTYSANKHFIPIANKPLIFYPIEAVVEAGVLDIAITYNPGGLEQAQAVLGDGQRWGAKFTYILQEKPAGLANIVEVCEQFLGGDSFVFHLGDNIFADGIKDLVDYFLQKKPNGLVAMVEHPDNTRLGVPYFDENGKVTKLVEKPQNPPHKFALPGIYFADSNFFKCFKGEDRLVSSARGEYEIPDAFQWMINHGFLVEVKEYKGRWVDPGKFDDWLETNQYLLDRNVQEKIESDLGGGVVMENRVQVGKECKIERSKIRGPVIIGDNVVIKDSFVGPYSSISDNCQIEKSHIENCVLMKGVKIIKIDKNIDTSLIGSDAQIIESTAPGSPLRLFVGENCKIEV